MIMKVKQRFESALSNVFIVTHLELIHKSSCYNNNDHISIVSVIKVRRPRASL